MSGSSVRTAGRTAPAWELPSRLIAAMLRVARRGLRRPARPWRVELELADGVAWSRRAGRGGATVRCLDGSVWLTREGDPEDRVLETGQAFRSERRGRIAVLALGSARVVVSMGET